MQTRLIQNGVFSTSVVHSDITIDCFITKDRIILLDTSPLLCNFKRDMISSELDDIKLVCCLLNCCHLIIVVTDNFPDLSILRLINQAELFSPSEFKHRPNLALIGNKVQPGNKLFQMDKRILNLDDSLFIPDLNSPSIDLFHDVQEIIQKFQEIVFMKKRFSMAENDEPFTEILWFRRFLTFVERLKKEKGDFFLKKYEALKDKFHQSVEN